MKKQGSTSDFITTRDSELYRNFLDILRAARNVPLRDMYGMAAQRSASRFWVSERRAAEVVSALLAARRRGAEHEKAFLENMYPLKRRMYEEISAKVLTLMDSDTSLCLTHAVDIIVNEPAPEFYLTAESAKVIIYRHRRRLRAGKAIQSERNKNLANALGIHKK